MKRYQTIMLTLPIGGGALLKQYDPKIMRARSRFEGVSTPRNEYAQKRVE